MLFDVAVIVAMAATVTEKSQSLGAHSVLEVIFTAVYITTHGTQQSYQLGAIGFGVFLFLFVFLFCFVFLGLHPAAYGDSQARGPVGATAACLHHSHSNTRTELHLQPTPQLKATPDP